MPNAYTSPTLGVQKPTQVSIHVFKKNIRNNKKPPCSSPPVLPTSPPYLFFWKHGPSPITQFSIIPRTFRQRFSQAHPFGFTASAVEAHGQSKEVERRWTLMIDISWRQFIPGTPRPTIYKWLFQLDDSQSLHRKWLQITKHPFF